VAGHSYQDLKVWQQAMKLAAEVYKITERLPAEERFALTDQLRRSAVSIPSNIAEGQRRYGDAETRNFCSIALGSTAELETQLLLSQKLYGINISAQLASCEAVGKMLTGLIRALKAKD
jgi:carbamoyl-phosphate synthase large subunit